MKPSSCFTLCFEAFEAGYSEAGVYGNRVINSIDQRVGWSQSFCRFWWRTTTWWIIIHIRHLVPAPSLSYTTRLWNTLKTKCSHKNMPKFFDYVQDEIPWKIFHNRILFVLFFWLLFINFRTQGIKLKSKTVINYTWKSNPKYRTCNIDLYNSIRNVHYGISFKVTW